MDKLLKEVVGTAREVRKATWEVRETVREVEKLLWRLGDCYQVGETSGNMGKLLRR